MRLSERNYSNRANPTNRNYISNALQIHPNWIFKCKRFPKI